MDTTFLGQVMPFLFLPFTLAGLIVGGIGIWEVIERKSLLKKTTAEAQGYIISRVQAVHSIDYQQGSDFNETTNDCDSKSYKTDAGDFLWLEFEVIDYKTSEKVLYNVRTKKPYKNSEAIISLPIKYNPYNPDEDYIIDDFFSRSIPKMKILALVSTLVIELGLSLYAWSVWNS